LIKNEKKDGTNPQLIPDAILLPHAHDHSHDQGCGCAEKTNECGCADSDESTGICSEDGCGCGGEDGPLPVTFIEKLRSGMNYSFGNLLQDIGVWFLGGVLLAGIFGALIPDGFIEKNLGDGFLPLLIMLAAAIPLYVCATASTPIAAALALKGLSPGAALVFLLAGPATNAASFTVVAKLLGKRSAFITLGP